jgi:hypothetical protein
MGEIWCPEPVRDSDEFWAIVDENGKILWITKNNAKYMAVFHSRGYAERVLNWLRDEVAKKLQEIHEKKEQLTSLPDVEQKLVVLGLFYYGFKEDMLKRAKVVRISLSYTVPAGGETASAKADSHSYSHV